MKTDQDVLFQFVALLLTAALVAYLNLSTRAARSRWVATPLTLKSWGFLTLSASTAVFLFYVLAHVNFPHQLQHTHEGLIEAKIHHRASCLSSRDQGEFLSALRHLHNNTVARQLARQYFARTLKPLEADEAEAEAEAHHIGCGCLPSKQAVRLCRSFVALIHVVLFGSGSCYAMAPLLLAVMWGRLRAFRARFFVRRPRLVSSTANASSLLESSRASAIASSSSFSPLSDESVLLPLINFVLCYAISVTLCFRLWMERERIDACRLVSGHWYTYTASTIAVVMVWCYLRYMARFAKSHGPLHRQTILFWTRFYHFWLVSHQLMALASLTNTQHFFHDSQEAVDGIQVALRHTFLILPMTLALLSLGRWLATSVTKRRRFFSHLSGSDSALSDRD